MSPTELSVGIHYVEPANPNDPKDAYGTILDIDNKYIHYVWTTHPNTPAWCSKTVFRYKDFEVIDIEDYL